MAPSAFQGCCTRWVFLLSITCYCQPIDFTCGQFGVIKDFFACSSSDFQLKNQQVVVSCQLTSRKSDRIAITAISPPVCLHLTDWALHFLGDCVFLPFTLFSTFFCLSWWCLTLINTTTTTINWIDAPLWMHVICIYLIRLFNHTLTLLCRVLCQRKSRSNCMKCVCTFVSLIGSQVCLGQCSFPIRWAGSITWHSAPVSLAALSNSISSPILAYAIIQDAITTLTFTWVIYIMQFYCLSDLRSSPRWLLCYTHT